MFVTTVILAGSCDSQVEAVWEVVSTIEGCIPHRVEPLRAVSDYSPPEDVGLILICLGGPEEDAEAVRVVKTATKARRPIPVIVISERDDPALRLRFLRLGAVDYMPSPLNFARLRFLIDLFTVAPRSRRADIVPSAPSPSANARDNVDGYLLCDQAIRELFDQAKTVAPLDTTVLLTGETGTGKTHLARLIHDQSPRRERPFRVVQCSALSPTLVESELFGHVRGAFTGADRDRVGKFADAENGTLLLDDVNCVPLETQAKLLRVVEERTFEPIGSNGVQTCQARLIATTNQPLERAVAAGKFRSDLYYRLAVVELEVPALRKCPRAIRPLVTKFLSDFCRQHGRQDHGMSGAALGALETFDWPGNVRELRNVIERAVALHPDKKIEPQDLPEAIRRARPRPAPVPQTPDAPAPATLESAEDNSEVDQIIHALGRNSDNRTLAALDLGISRGALYRKMRRYGLS